MPSTESPSYDLLRLVFDQVNEGIAFQSQTGVILACNNSALKILGLSRDQLIGSSSTDPRWRTIHEDGTPFPGDTHPSMVTLRTGKPQQNIVMGIYKPDGSLAWISISTQPVQNAHEKKPSAVVVSFSDITERKRAEDALRERERHTQALLRLSKNLEQAKTYDDILAVVQNEIRAVIGYRSVWVYLFSEDRQHARVLISKGEMSDSIQQSENVATLTIRGDRMLEEIAEAKNIVVVEDARTDPRTDKKIVEQLQNRTIVNIPIFLLERPIGTVGTGTFGEEGIRIPTQSEREFLSTLASHVAAALDRIHLLNEVRSSEQHLRDANEQLRVTAQAGHIGLWDWNLQTNSVYYSPEWKHQIGFEDHEISNTLDEWKNRVHPDDLEKTFATVQSFIQQPWPDYRIEFRFRHKDGSYRWILAQASLLYDTNGIPNRMLGSHIDITERKNAEIRVNYLTRLYATLSQVNQTIVRSKQKEQMFQEICTIAVNFGKFPLAWIGLMDAGSGKIKPAVHAGSEQAYEQYAESKTKLNKAIDSALRSGKVVVQRLDVGPGTDRSEQQEIWFRSCAAIPFTTKGIVAGALSLYTAETEFFTQQEELTLLSEIGTDISFALDAMEIGREHDRKEEALRQSEQHLREVYENSPLAYQSLDVEGRYIDINPSWCTMTGFNRDEVIGKLNSEFFTPLYAEKIKKIFPQFLRQGEIHGVELEMIRKDGTQFMVELDGKIGYDDMGRFRQTYCILHDITERKQAEERMKLMNFALEAVHESAFLIDRSAHFHYVNEETCRMLGYSRDELMALNVADVDPDFPLERWASHWKDLKEHGSLKFEGHHKAKDGRLIPVEIVANYFEYGGTAYSLALANDISERKRIEQKVLQLAAIVESSEDGIIGKDLHGIITSWNKGAENIYGYMEGDVIGKSISLLIPRAMENEMVSILDKIKSGLHVDRYETKRQRKDGVIIDVSLTVSPVKDSTGTIVAASTIARDITQRKRAAQELSNTNELLERMFTSIHVLVAYMDKNFNFIRVNTAYAASDGRTPEFYIGKNHFQLYPNKENEIIFKNVIATGEPYTVFAKPFEYAGHPERGISYWDWRLEPVRDTSGNVQGLILSLLDVTEQKRAEKALLANSIYSRSLIEASLDPFVTISLDGKITDVNQASESLTGLMRNQMIGTDFSNYFSEPEKAREGYQQALQQGSIKDFPLTMRHISGKATDVLYNASVYKNEYGIVQGVFATARDITDRKRAEQAVRENEIKRHRLELELTQMQKLESLGTLASGIAHDFNNILSIIMVHSSIGERMLTNSEKLLKSLDAINKASQRGASLVKQLLTFARKTEVIFQSVHLNDLISEIVKLLRETFPKTIIISTQLEDKLPSVVADVTQMHQVLMNLCINARDAMPKGGSLTVTTATVDNSELDMKFEKATARKYALVTISDTGIGMDDETKQRMFDPFFTTKGPGKGTGLGLALVHSIVESHSGMIDVSSEIGKGTTFHIYIPLQESGLAVASPAETADEKIPGGTETILLVEDEDLLVEMVKALLETKGYSVLVARDGEEGVAMYTEHQQRIAAVLTDFGLPKFSGDEVIKRIVSINPSVKIILASGFIDPAMKTELTKLGVKLFIQKPYSLREVERNLRALLDDKV